MALATIVAGLLVACEAAPTLGRACERASDCRSPLVSAFGRCHEECRASRDCPIGARCVAREGGGACTLDSENHCDSNVCPWPLVCVSDQCSTGCVTDADCLEGPCNAGTCDEPMRADFDAGEPDASDAEPGECELVPGAVVTLIEDVETDRISLATSGGLVHVGAIGDVSREGVTAYVATLPLADLTAPATVVDLRYQAFFLTMPRSIAVAPLPTPGPIGSIGVLATFDAWTGAGDAYRLLVPVATGLVDLALTCSTTCIEDVALSTMLAGGTIARVVAVHAEGGVVTAFARQSGDISVHSPASGASRVYPVVPAPAAGRQIVDLQLSALFAGGTAEVVLAVLEGPTGAATGDTIRLVRLTPPAGCP